MNIDGVSTGIVIDHIKAGKSMEIYKLFVKIKNVKSKRRPNRQN